MKFRKRKHQVLPLGKNKPRHQYRLGTDWMESSSAEKVLLDTTMKRSQQCPPSGKGGQQHPGLR